MAKKHKCGFCHGINTCHETSTCSRGLGDDGHKGGRDGTESRWIDE